ncbi:MAG: SusC/RagA family TonB-linked outer membrane protein [Bacteroidetes bacterium]|nr:SusC/RagA family TonB-linked outer membrane protein [Bacteroidota bacterium]MBS1756143.1 SusC/RagA family TonB-linked outer membrane protein [Bacteroidota bacterium]
MRRFLSLFTMLMLCGVFAFAQNRVVTGTITDDKGAPVEGASIRVKGTRSGASADAQGFYRLSVPKGAVLTISGVGITAKDVHVGTESVVNVTVSRSGAPELTAVVVTAAGIRRSEKTTGYAVTKVDPGVLLQKSEPDVLKGLQGKVAGVDIRTSQGTPGSATRIQIRGNSSFYGDNQPLIVVDGVPFSNDQVGDNSLGGSGAYGTGLSDLDPNDIANMTILKGASAAALYGSRASNGVVLITTKSGSVSRARKGMEVNAKSSISFENISNLPDYQNKYGTGSQGVAGGGSNGSWGARFGSPGNDSVAVWADYKRTYPELFPTGLVAYRAYPNNVKDQFKTGVVTENSIGFTGGDEKTSFALTASQLSHSGYVPNNRFTRTNIGLGGFSRLTNGLGVRANFSYSRSNQNGGLFGENQAGASSQFGRSMFLGRSWDMSLPYEDKLGNSISFVGTQFDNPFWAAKYNTVNTISERIIANTHLDYQIAKWVKVDVGAGTDISQLGRTTVQEVSSRGGLGSLELTNYKKQETQANLMFTLTPNTGDNFTTKVLAGTDFNQRLATSIFTSGGETGGGGYIVRGLHTIANFLPADVRTSNGYSEKRIIGFLGEVDLGYKNFAFLTLTGRNDISSTLPIQNRSYFYPSVSGSFVFTDAFKMGKGFLEYGKLRAGWAKVGNDTDPYNVYNTFGLGSGYLGQPNGAISSSSKNPDLQPEFSRETEVGTELTFYKRYVSLDFTYYNKFSYNLLTPVTLAPSTGYSNSFTNAGSIRNKGVEIELTLRPIQSKSFNWEIKGAFTQNRNTVVALTEGVQRINLGGGFTDNTTELEPGKPFGFLYGSKVFRDSATGALLINPANGSMIEDPNQMYQIGNPNPDYKLGITNTFKYKGFFASVLFDMTKGGDISSVTISSELGRGVTKDTEDRETGFVIPGVYGDPLTGKAILVNGKTVPNQTRITPNDLWFSPSNGNTFAINTATEWNVYDATVYRLREVTLGYDLPKSLLGKSRISGITFSISARNIFYYAPGFPKYTHFDPEVSSFGNSSVQGLEFSAAPTTRRIGVNLSLTF